MRKIFDGIVLLAIAGFSFAYVTDAPFREAVVSRARAIHAQPLAQNAREIPQAIAHQVVGGCPAPITYRIGEIDPRFGVTRDQVVAQAKAAAQAWNEASGAELLAFREDGSVPVSLIYDNRQALAVQIESEMGGLHSQEEKLNFVQKKYTALKQSLEQKSVAYQALEKQYTKALDQFEQRVRKFEANPTEYDESAQKDLQKERKRVQKLYQQTESSRREFNVAVDELNLLVKNANRLKDSFNHGVEAYNAAVDAKQQVTEDFAGVYFSDHRIEVYQFLNDDELRAVLIHEMGHALGFEHNPDQHSIMYFQTEPGQVLTPDDQQKARGLCKEKL